MPRKRAEWGKGKTKSNAGKREKAEPQTRNLVAQVPNDRDAPVLRLMSRMHWSRAELMYYVMNFQKYDRYNHGYIHASDLKLALESMGFNLCFF